MWNRQQWLKDPETGKRRYVDRPREEWQVREMPHPRIVPEEIWSAVRARDRRNAGREKAARQCAHCSRACCAARAAADP